MIPVLNRVGTIRRCVESALNQTYSDIEVIIVDSQSEDGTQDILYELKAKDNRVTVLQTEKGIGPLRSWIQGLDRCTGEYAKILYSDDWIEPDFLEAAVPLLQHNPDVGLVFTSAILHASEYDDAYYLYMDTPFFSVHNYLLKMLTLDDMPVSPACSLIRRKDAAFPYPIGTNEELNQFALRFGAGPDVLFMINAAVKYERVAHIPRFLSHLGAGGFSYVYSAQVQRAYDLAFQYFLQSTRNERLSSDVAKLKRKRKLKSALGSLAKRLFGF